MQWTATTPGRLDAFLASVIADLSRSQLQKLIKEGSITINDIVVTKPAQKLDEGDAVILNIQKEEENQKPKTSKQVNMNLPILYENDDCLVVNKPARIAVHPGTGIGPDDPTILSGIAHLFTERNLPFDPAAVLVHRLDKDTTGCLLIAKHPKAHRELQQQFQDRSVHKTYLAIVAGVPEQSEAMIDAPIGRNLHDRTKMSILSTGTSRAATTGYKTLDQTDVCALLQCTLHTGRTHQIRVHLSSIGHPILGDTTYVSTRNEDLTERLQISGLCLHAHQLSFTDTADERVTVVADVPEGFEKNLKRCELKAKNLL